MDRLFSDDLKSLEALGVKVSKGTSEAVLQELAVKRENCIQSMEELFGGLYKGAKLSGISRAGKTGGAGTGASGSG